MPGVALLFPTGTDPRSPYLALPCLAGTLRRAGVEVALYDLDVGGLHALLTASRLLEAGRILASFGRIEVQSNALMHRLSGMAEELAQRARPALAALRDPARFYNPNEFNSARETIYDALDLISVATRGKVRYAISPVRFDVTGTNIHSLADLLDVTADDSCNLFREYWEAELYPALSAQAPELVGITITNAQQMIPGLTLARRLRERGYFVVLGGALLAKFADRLRVLPEFFQTFADGVVPYEGETALVELVGALRTSRDFSKVPNLLFPCGSSIYSGPTHIEDVETLPCPDFEGLPLDEYLTPVPVLPTYLGKGCYFNRCKFCDIPYINHISQKAYRLRSVERVVSDLLTLKRRHGCRHFEFIDEALPARTLEHLADAIEPYESEHFRFVGYARLEPSFSPEVCNKLARMGLRKLFFGLESGCQETLDHMDKGICLSDVPNVLANCSASGIRYHLFAIIGFPEETEERARETFEFFRRHSELIDHPGNSFDIHPFGLELRTAYFNEAGKNGAVIDPGVLRHEFVIGVGSQWTNSRGLSVNQTEELVNEFYLELHKLYSRYHAAPQHLWPAFEEFSVLYADHYSDLEFAYRTSLPDDDDESLYWFQWNPAAHIETFKDEFVVIAGRYGDVLMDLRTYRQIEDVGPRTVREAVLDLAEFVPDLSGIDARNFVRETINSLVHRGLLQIQPSLHQMSRPAARRFPPRLCVDA